MSLRTRLALAFALVTVLVAASTGLLSFRAAASRITDANDTTLQAAATSLATGETGVLATPPGNPGDRRQPPDPEDAQRGQTITARLVAADAAPSPSWGPSRRRYLSPPPRSSSPGARYAARPTRGRRRRTTPPTGSSPSRSPTGGARCRSR